MIRFFKQSSHLMKNTINLLVLLVFTAVVYGQDSGYKFIMMKDLPVTPVKNQYVSPTCWSFSGLSFFESELIRMGKKSYDLSEMYMVRETYKKKAEEFLKRKGNTSFAGGGEYQDLLNICREAGLVPEEAYPGLNYGEKRHDHHEMDAVLKGYMQGLLKSPKLTTAWSNGLNGILDAYLGKTSDDFQFDNKLYTATSFMSELELNPDDYIIISSFNNHPFYEEFIIKEVPENWTPSICYNLPLDELMQVIDNALINDYTVAWASGINDKGFSMKRGVAIIPEKDWSKMSAQESTEVFQGPSPQKVITQEVRQEAFEDSEVTGDHGMHMVGIAQDQAGNTFYKVKNSWGATGLYKGFIFVSKPFVMLKTTTCMVNKKALPVSIAQRMGILTTPGKTLTIVDSDIKQIPGSSPQGTGSQ